MVKCIKVLILRKDTHLLFIKLINLLFETTIHGKHSQQKSYFNFWCSQKVCNYLAFTQPYLCQHVRVERSKCLTSMSPHSSQGCRPWGYRGYHGMAPLDFSKSVNLISTRRGRLCPIHHYWHPRIFRPAYGPVVVYLHRQIPQFCNGAKVI